MSCQVSMNGVFYANTELCSVFIGWKDGGPEIIGEMWRERGEIKNRNVNKGKTRAE